MKKIIILTTLVAVIIIAFACNSGSTTKANKDLPAQELALNYYTCPMHPEITSDKPGKCPICGMDLVKAEKPVSDSTQVK